MAFLPLVPLLHAQEPAVSLKLDFVAWGDAVTGLSLKPGQSKGDIKALSFRYSQPVDYSGPAIMEIYKTGTGEASPNAPKPTAEDLAQELRPLVAEEPTAGSQDPAKPKQGLALELENRRKKNPTLVALAQLPTVGCRRATLLLAPADSSTYTVYVIDDDPSKLPMGQIRVHNLSPLTIALRCDGKQNKELKTQETFVVSVQNQQVIYELAYKLDDTWKMQENNIIPVRATEQTQMIVLKSKNKFFLSTDGSSGGFLQVVTLRRGPAIQ